MRRGNNRRLVRAQRILVCRIEYIAIRNVAVTQEHFVRRIAVRTEEPHAQGLVRGNDDPVHLALTGAQRQILRYVDMHFRHIDVNDAGRRRLVVGLELSFVYIVVNVRPHDNPILAALGRRNKRGERRRIVRARRERSRMRHFAEQSVAHVPRVVARQVHRVGPRSVRRRTR